VKRWSLLVLAVTVTGVLAWTSTQKASAYDNYENSCGYWPHTYGHLLSLGYKWGSNLQTPGSWWRNAFEASLSDWNQTPTNVSFYSNSNGPVTMNTYNEDDGRSGKTIWSCSGSTLVSAVSMGNVFNTSSNANVRRSVSGHELGHAIGLGHSYYFALMGYNPDPSTYYVPQQDDIDGVNVLYP
jgi:hypothetical protein